MAGSLPLKNDVQPVTQLPQDRQHLVAVQLHRRTRRSSATAASTTFCSKFNIISNSLRILKID